MRAQPPQQGAALLMALLVVALVTTLSSAFAWQAWRHTTEEQAERLRMQAQAILLPAIDWARLILRQDARSGTVDHLGEAWAMNLPPARLSTLLSASDTSGEIDDARALLGGRIEDAQARINLLDLVQADGTPSTAWRAVFERLYAALGLQPARVSLLQQELAAALAAAGGTAATGPLMPHDMAQLAWLGATPAEIARLAPYVTVLPERTTVNVNTASRPVLAAVLGGVDAPTLQRVATAQRSPHFSTVGALLALLGETSDQGTDLSALVGVGSTYFLATGTLELEGRTLAEQALLRRSGTTTTIQSLAPLYVVTVGSGAATP